jgi:hypothetical protein
MGTYTVESYEALKALTACPYNANAACDFSGLAITIQCNNATLDTGGLYGRFFYGSGSGSSIAIMQCSILGAGAKADVSELRFWMYSPFFASSLTFLALCSIFPVDHYPTQKVKYPGAIYAKRADIKIYTSTFQSNTAGAIYAAGADVKIYSSTFKANNALNGTFATYSSLNVRSYYYLNSVTSH